MTGAAGFIGRHTVHAFHQAGYRVTALDLREGPHHLAGAATWARSDFTAPAVLDDVAAGSYQTVVHQAGISDTRAPSGPHLDETNTLGPLRLADACRRGGARLIYASSHAVYGTLFHRAPIAETADEDRAQCSGPLNSYAASKLELDRQMRLRHGSGLQWIGLRYTNVVGPDEADKGPMASILTQLLHQAAETGRLKIFEDSLTAARDYTPVDSVTAVLVALASGPPAAPGLYNLGSGHATSFADIAHWCARWHRKTRGGALMVELIPNPVASAYQYFTCADMTALNAELPGRSMQGPSELEAYAAELFHLFREQAE
ncbi:MAG: NAD-dependent epimerase/dehydratase family protein [Catenulispora sp.]|nr:NAD-dependent epimerase/dehydratase family protein [Catenulispora sp.]